VNLVSSWRNQLVSRPALSGPSDLGEALSVWGSLRWPHGFIRSWGLAHPAARPLIPCRLAELYGSKNGSVMTDVGDHRQIAIRQLERDLDNLRRRYAALDTAVRYLKIGFVLFVIALIALIIWAATTRNGALAAGVFILFIIAAVLAYLGPLSMTPFWAFGGPEPRWIDVVSWWRGAKRREAMAVEDMIADRKQRLAALRASTAAPPQTVPLCQFHTQQRTRATFNILQW
jgi:hypothetical protein